MRLVAIGVILMIAATAGTAGAYKIKNWPTINEISEVVVNPGGAKDMNFTFKNRLNFDLENAVLELEVYLRLLDDDAQRIHEVSTPPELHPIGTEDYDTVPGVVDQFVLGEVASKQKINIRFNVDTDMGTPAGVYVIRIRLSFDRRGEKVEFWSRGHFTTDQYKEAMNGTFPEGVGGTILETSFEVKTRSNKEVFWLLPIGAALSFAAGIYYWRKAR